MLKTVMSLIRLHFNYDSLSSKKKKKKKESLMLWNLATRHYMVEKENATSVFPFHSSVMNRELSK